MDKRKKIFYLLSLIILTGGIARAGDVTIIDGKHYSEVFGEMRNYRIFLPPGYDDNPGKRYPVIYFYHGWSQRYFGSISTPHSDEGDSNGGDNIAGYVASHEVIVVRPDGYNRRPDAPYYLRPYNIGPVETYRQFPLYFPEIVHYVDDHYRTIPDRKHRAISGLSMGGFMTYWIAGKYPDLVSAAGNFCGSTEFVAGPYDFPVEYRHLDMYENYGGVKVRLNYGDQDFIRDYHHDVNRIWTRVMDNYTYKVYHAAHSTCGLGEMFDFILNTFDDALSKPDTWSHIDVYPDFTVWGYKVQSDRHYPGFNLLENVDRNGFRSSVREFLPDGSVMPFVRVTVTTAPVYEKNKAYLVQDVNLTANSHKTFEINSDADGRIKIELDGALHEIGIGERNGKPELAVARTEVVNADWAVPGKKVDLKVHLLNKGFSATGDVRAVLIPENNDVVVSHNEAHVGIVTENTLATTRKPFTFLVRNDSATVARFRLEIKDDRGHAWNRHFIVHVYPQAGTFDNVVVADGKRFTVAAAGNDTLSMVLGKGNGDGIANPGESIVLLVRDHGTYYRTKLVTADPWVNPFGLKVRKSNSWSDYDHVGATEKYSVPLISSETPEDHQILFFATYWLPEYPYHNEQYGVIRIAVTGKDQTSPVVRQAEITGDNTVHAWVYDGGRIGSVRAHLIPREAEGEYFDIELNDKGADGDRVAGDNRFSLQVRPEKFGLYRMELEVTDVYGNILRQECQGEYQVH